MVAISTLILIAYIVTFALLINKYIGEISQRNNVLLLDIGH